LSAEERGWYPNIYEGGPLDVTHAEQFPAAHRYLASHEDPAVWRVISVVTNSSVNSTALDYVQRVYDYVQAGTAGDDRIQYQTLCLVRSDGQVTDSICERRSSD